MIALALVLALIVVCARLSATRLDGSDRAWQDYARRTHHSMKWSSSMAARPPVLLALALGVLHGRRGAVLALASVNAALVMVRVLLTVATAHSFARRGVAYWLSPLADTPAAMRVVETMAHRPREWRGEPPPVAAAS